MTVTPPLNPILMLMEGSGSLAVRTRAGVSSAVGSGPVRYGPADGARINWMHDPRGQYFGLSAGWFGNIGVASQASGVRFTSHTTDPSYSYGVVYTSQRAAVASLAGRQVWARVKVHGSGVIPSLQFKAWDPTYTISTGPDFDYWPIPTEPTVVVLGPITCMNDVVEIDAFRFGNGVAATDWWVEVDEVMITTEDPTGWDFFDGDWPGDQVNYAIDGGAEDAGTFTPAWANVGGNATVTRVAGGHHGSYAARFLNPGTLGFDGGRFAVYDYATVTALMGRQVWMRASWKKNGPSAPTRIAMRAWTAGYASTIQSSPFGVDVPGPVPDDWEDIVFGPLTVPVDCPQVDIVVYGGASTNGSEAFDLLLDDVMLTTIDPTNLPYFADRLPGAVWLNPLTGVLGTRNLSPSVSWAEPLVEEDTVNYFPNPVLDHASTTGEQIGYPEGANIVLSRVLRWGEGVDGRVVKCVTAASESNDEWQSMYMGLNTFAPGDFVTVSLDIEMPVGVQFHIVIAASAGNSGGAITIARHTSPALVGTGKKKRYSYTSGALQALTTTCWFGVYRDGATVQTFYLGDFQCEKKKYATTLCHGWMGTGYSWFGTAHASRSVRAGAAIAFPTTGLGIDPAQGTIVSRRMFPSQGRMSAGTPGVDPVTVSIGSDLNTVGIDSFAEWRETGHVRFISGQAAYPIASAAAPVVYGDWETGYSEWTPTDLYVGLIGGASGSTVRVPAPSSTIDPTPIGIGGYYFSYQPINGYIGPVAIYDKALSPARLALIGEAIDSNGAIDLWTLFEEWEAVGLPLESVALQSGQATAGVKAVALPMESSVLQDGRATAGVTAVALPMEGVERQDGKALALDAAKLIPVPDTRSVITIGES